MMASSELLQEYGYHVTFMDNLCQVEFPSLKRYLYNSKVYHATERDY